MKTGSFNKDNRFGYCVTWSLMFTILRILNPSKSVEELNNLLLDGTPSELQSKILKFAKYYSDILKNSKNFIV